MNKITVKYLIALIILTILVVAGIYNYNLIRIPTLISEEIEIKKVEQRKKANKELDKKIVNHDANYDVYPLYHKFSTNFEKTSHFINDKDIYKAYEFHPTHFQSLKFMALDLGLENNIRGNSSCKPVENGDWPGIYKSGFAFGVIKRGHGSYDLIKYILIPTYVAYLKQEESFYYDYMPTIDEMLETAYQFYVNNSKSDMFNLIIKSNNTFLYDIQLHNDFYTIEEVEEKESIFKDIFRNEEGKYMYNGYARVYMEPIVIYPYKIVLREYYVKELTEERIKEEKEKLNNVYGIIESFLVCFLILLICNLLYLNKKSKETTLVRLRRLCNPKYYIKTHNQELISISNSLYSKSLDIDEDDINQINELASQIEAQLGKNLIKKEEIKELKRKCNPKRFLKPYDPIKIEKANKLYNRLNKEHITYSDFLSIKEEIQSL